MHTVEEFVAFIMYTFVGSFFSLKNQKQCGSQDAIVESHDRGGDHGVEAETALQYDL